MAFRASQPRGSSERIRRLSVGSGCFGVRSSTQLPSASFGCAGFRKRTVNSARRRPSPARKLPAGRAWRRLRPSIALDPPSGLFERFARVRPVVESGWEMPLVIMALLAGASESELLERWRPAPLLAELGLAREAVAAAVDQVRD